MSAFNELEIWIPATENALVESDVSSQKRRGQETEVTQTNFKGRKDITNYRQKKTKSRKRKSPEEAKLPLDEEPPSLSISFPEKQKSQR